VGLQTSSPEACADTDGSILVQESIRSKCQRCGLLDGTR
jgi:hypothetical protein